MEKTIEADPGKEISAVVDYFTTFKILTPEHTFRLEMYNARAQGFPLEYMAPFPLITRLVEKNRGKKRGDFYHFNDYNIDCLFHGFCDVPIGTPFHVQGRDLDISRLVLHQDDIAEMLHNSHIPSGIYSLPIVQALLNKTLRD